MAASILADIVLLLHFAYILAVILPVPLVPLGWKLRWAWVRSRRIRLLHLSMMGIVLAEALFGLACPLTFLEQALLQSAGRHGYDEGFLSFWLGRILYWELPLWAFFLAYLALFSLILFLWKRFPPLHK